MTDLHFQKVNKLFLAIPVLVLITIMATRIFEPRSLADRPYPEFVQANGNVVELALTAEPDQILLGTNEAVETWTYNGQVPGPEIRITKGDTLKINFTNNLPQETTIHFHGVRVPNAMDGVPGVTQQPVQPGESFTYQFTPKDTGTFWYHPHVRSSEQVERGLYGVLIVEDDADPDFNQDQVVVLDDWRLNPTSQLDERFNTGHDLMHDGRWGNYITVNSQTDYALDVQAGERVRLRFVNTSNARVYKLDFGQLQAQAFAVDGLLAQRPFTAQGFELAPGNRLDVDVTVPASLLPHEQPQQHYYIRDTFTGQPYNLMEIIVGSTATQIQTFDTPSALDFPNWTEQTKKIVDAEYRLNARRGGQFGIEWTINGKAYPDYDPISLKKGEYNRIRFTNESARLHPMHLHGQFFKVLTRNGQVVDEPYLRDTVLIHPRESVDIGLMPLDEGKWLNHCHALEHAESGMITVVEVK